MNRENTEGIRLQKVLAQAGVGSRRACEDLIDEGRVSINGEVVREQGVRVIVKDVEIRVDGVLIAEEADLVVLALNKPRGVLTTMQDELGRECVGDFVQDRPERLFHVGRLDADTEGLLFLTNDGQLANHLTHPTFGVTKTYFVVIPGPVPGDLGKRLKAGIALEDGLARFDSFRVVDANKSDALVEVVLHEGRHRIVRRVFEELDMPVKNLIRTAVGPITLGDMKPGHLRRLSHTELRSLRSAAGM